MVLFTSPDSVVAAAADVATTTPGTKNSSHSSSPWAQPWIVRPMRSPRREDLQVTMVTTTTSPPHSSTRGEPMGERRHVQHQHQQQWNNTNAKNMGDSIRRAGNERHAVISNTSGRGRNIVTTDGEFGIVDAVEQPLHEQDLLVSPLSSPDNAWTRRTLASAGNDDGGRSSSCLSGIGFDEKIIFETTVASTTTTTAIGDSSRGGGGAESIVRDRINSASSAKTRRDVATTGAEKLSQHHEEESLQSNTDSNSDVGANNTQIAALLRVTRENVPISVDHDSGMETPCDSEALTAASAAAVVATSGVITTKSPRQINEDDGGQAKENRGKREGIHLAQTNEAREQSKRLALEVARLRCALSRTTAELDNTRRGVSGQLKVRV